MHDTRRETIDTPSLTEHSDRRRDLLLLAIVLVGIICRVVQYLAHPSFWHDEALVVLNVANKTCAELMGRLDYAQAAPPLFLFAQRGLLLWLGENEYALRLVSLICGVTSLSLFALICRRIFPGWIAPLTLAIYTFSNKLIWHSAEVKPYSGDAMVAVLLLYLGLRMLARPPEDGQPEAVRENPTRGFILVSCVAAIAVWFSFPTSFVFGALSLAVLPTMWRRGMRGWLAYAGGNVLFAVSFLLLYKFSIHPQHVAALSNYWVDDFPNYARPLHIPLWLLGEIYGLADHPYRSFGWLVLPLAVLGAVGFVKDRRRFLLAICLLPVGLAIIAAFALQYPFNGDRLTLYLVPGLFLLCGGGIQFLRQRLDVPASRWRLAWIIVALILVLRGVGEAAYRLVAPRVRSGARPAALYIRAHRQPGEGLYLVGEPEERTLNFKSNLCLELLCYWPNPPQPWHAGLPDATAISENRFWVMFTTQPKHDTKFIEPLVDHLAPAAVLREKYFTPGGGGAAILFERKPAAATTALSTQPVTKP